jgi:hypothetical protein
MTSRTRALPALLALLAALGGAPALADDDDGGGGSDGGAAGGGGGAGGGGAGGDGAGGQGGDGAGASVQDRRGLGPNPGSIPMPPSLHRTLDRLFGASPPAPVRPRAAPAAVELVATGIAPAAIPRLRAQGFAILAQRPGPELVRLRAPAGVTEATALARLRAVAPGAVADRNHRYRLASDIAGSPAAPDSGSRCASSAPGLIALVDTGVDARHPALAGRIERQETLRGPGRRPARTAHGTAVALRLAAGAPAARIAVLDAFHLGPNGEAADAYDLAGALARAAAIGAAVANVSVVGPANAVVDRVGGQAAAGGVVFVAAAGNDGPRAAPLHPAAYPWAVAVTAVDERGRPWARAAAGPHIAFAAHGVGVSLAASGTARPRRWSGTSFAAPVVSATLAGLPRSGPLSIESLAALARDAGAPGRDPVFGWGLVDGSHCEDALALGQPAAAAGSGD